MISIESVSKHFGEIRAVSEVSLTAEDSRVTGLLGPNGAGKSTTLRIASSVIAADSGRVLVDGVDVAEDPLGTRQRLGVLPHSAGLYPRLTARENIRYFAKLNGLRGEPLHSAVENIIERLDIGDYADRRAQGFSHGQRLRVALARALVHGPRNVILDEPTNGLDVMATRALREVVRDLRASGFCVLFSSHVMQEVAALCDRLVIIAGGRVVARGTLDEIREQTGEQDLEEAFLTAVSGTGERSA
ncbi:MAG: ATP-binding cassette domain-containing protein [Gammaproteobacteria bacterium]|jgi:sodium transport system ATP-binding protein